MVSGNFCKHVLGDKFLSPVSRSFFSAHCSHCSLQRHLLLLLLFDKNGDNSICLKGVTVMMKQKKENSPRVPPAIKQVLSKCQQLPVPWLSCHCCGHHNIYTGVICASVSHLCILPFEDRHNGSFRSVCESSLE